MIVFTIVFNKLKSHIHFCNVKKESHQGGVYDDDEEVYTVTKKKGLEDVQPVFMTRNDMFIAHTKCVHAGGEATMGKSRVKRTLVDEHGERKYVADVSVYFYITLDMENYGAVARKAVIRN